MAQAIDKQEVHDLVDQLHPDQLPVAAALLRSMQADGDDEPVTEEHLQRLCEAKAALARGEKGMPMEEFMAELGITMEDLGAIR